MDNLPSRELLANFYVAIRMLQQPVEKLFEEMKPSPSCIISDANLAWPADTARNSNFSDLNDTRREIRAAELVADGAISKVMDKGPEGRKRRERVRKLGVMANKAMEQGGSSNHNIALLIENIKQHATVHSSKDTS
ncbi:unnamed protein product, partial [Vitis vinifera]